MPVYCVELSSAVQLALQAEREVVGHRAHEVWVPNRDCLVKEGALTLKDPVTRKFKVVKHRNILSKKNLEFEKK